jgi:hypothetical protein
MNEHNMIKRKQDFFFFNIYLLTYPISLNKNKRNIKFHFLLLLLIYSRVSLISDSQLSCLERMKVYCYENIYIYIYIF